MKTIAVLLAVCIVLAGTVPVSAAPTMYSINTTVTKIIQQPDYCTLWVARGANGNVLSESGPVCSLKKGGKITLNYAVDYKTVCDWRGRNCARRIVYVYDNAYPGW